jgi:hypothetical protein
MRGIMRNAKRKKQERNADAKTKQSGKQGESGRKKANDTDSRIGECATVLARVLNTRVILAEDGDRGNPEEV